MAVYFVHDPAQKVVKIGHSQNLDLRLAALRRERGDHLTLLASAPGNHRIEASLHHLLWDQHVGHEWFHDHPRVLAVAQVVGMGLFAFDKLARVPSPLMSEASCRGHVTRKERAARLAASAA